MTRGSTIVGALVVALALGQGARDVAWGVAHWSAMGPLRPGETMPRFAARRLGGELFDQTSLQGKVSVVTFWATWCGVCRTELADLDELRAEYAARPDVQFVAVNREGGGVTAREAEPVAEAFMRARGLSLPVAVDDGNMARTFRVGPIPHTVVFDRQGTIQHVHQGRVTNTTIRDEVEALLR